MRIYPVQYYMRDFIKVYPNDLDAIKHTALRKVAKPLKFPLSDRDKKIIRKLQKILDCDERIGSVSAPQIGISKRVFVINIPTIRGVPDSGFPNSVLINPSFTPAGPEKEAEGEECYSVKWTGSMVPRWYRINYKAYNVEGQLMEGLVDDWVARTMQHEVDHLNGIIYLDRVVK